MKSLKIVKTDSIMEKELQLKDLYDGFRDAKVIKAYKKLIDEEDALESLKVYAEIIEKMEEQDRLEAIEQSDNCPNR